MSLLIFPISLVAAELRFCSPACPRQLELSRSQISTSGSYRVSGNWRQGHRIKEYLELDGTYKDYEIQLLHCIYPGLVENYSI